MNNKTNNDLASNYTNEVQKQYESIVNTITKNFDYDIKLTSLIEKTSLLFDNIENPDYSAYAQSHDPFDFLNPNHKIVFASYYLPARRATIIHELSHLIYNEYLGHLKNGAHCLEFAIINYCLLYRVCYNDYKLNKCFFDSYDIHEDKAYPNLSINPCKFDSLIKSIEWQTVEELCEIATNLSKKIRKNLVV